MVNGRWARRISPPTCRRTSAAAKHWSGNVGLRYVDIDQEINSYQAVASAANADVTQPLRQLDLPGHQQQAQQGAAQREPEVQHGATMWCSASPLRETMTLPDYSALGAASWGSDLNRTGGGGNPNLKPVQSTNFDGNLEWLFHGPRPGVGRCLFDGPEGLRRLWHRERGCCTAS